MSPTPQTIFLVDDDMTNLNVGKNALNDHYNVMTLNSGERLLKMLEKRLPDLILLDINMPEMDGYETLTRLKANPNTKHIPVVFLTSLTDEAEELKGFSLGALDYVIKPFSKPLLLKRLEMHLLVEKQRKELMDYSHNLEQMVNDRTQAIVNLKGVVLETMAALVEDRDEITGAHIQRTTGYLEVLVDELLERDIYTADIHHFGKELILQSCALHDVGKISVADAVLFKPGKLTTEEFELIKAHTTYGAQIITRIKDKATDSEFLECARIFALTHHEKWDGTGYPQALAGDDIPLLGRLMAIADVYDALVSERPYKKALGHQQAIDIIIEGKGKHFDPTLIDILQDVHPKFALVAIKYGSHA